MQVMKTKIIEKLWGSSIGFANWIYNGYSLDSRKEKAARRKPEGSTEGISQNQILEKQEHGKVRHQGLANSFSMLIEMSGLEPQLGR